MRAGADLGLMAGAIALAVLSLGGCFTMSENYVADEALSPEQIQGVRRGVTTKQEILERFGPPTAIARRGSTMVYPPPGMAKRGRADVQSDAFFELFSYGRPLRGAEVVYYYQASAVKATGVLIIPIVGGGNYSRKVVAARLWLLVDGDTGIVEDYVFRGAD